MAEKQRRWYIKVIGGKTAKLIGVVAAPDAEAAIKIAIKELAVASDLHSRLIAREMI